MVRCQIFTRVAAVLLLSMLAAVDIRGLAVPACWHSQSPAPSICRLTPPGRPPAPHCPRPDLACTDIVECNFTKAKLHQEYGRTGPIRSNQIGLAWQRICANTSVLRSGDDRNLNNKRRTLVHLAVDANGAAVEFDGFFGDN